MNQYLINGGQRLEGRIKVGGSKNASLPLLAASLLGEGESTLHNIPQLSDVQHMVEVLESLGAKTYSDGDALTIEAQTITGVSISENSMRQMRASNLFLGPLLARLGMARIPLPGGCRIGSRPMDQHLKGLAALGVDIIERHGYIEAKSAGMRGADIYFDVPSVGATENLMMAAVAAEGTTVLRNAAREPEIVDLQNMLNAMGAQIAGAGTSMIRVNGRRPLHGTTYTVVPDRIEAGTHMLAAVMTQGDLEINDVVPEHMSPVIAKIKQCGAEVSVKGNSVRVRHVGGIKPMEIKTMSYPGFPTDMQPQFLALMTLADGTSVMTETIFENRFQHVDELRRMGAKIIVEGRSAIIHGVKKLEGAFVEASDLRAGAALFLAALAAEEASVLRNIDYIFRGYERLEEKYQAVGAKVQRMI
ncbi:MAG: UDP-N-acetylglucosamine 1-carboxyvinyltransferase [Gracilibacteraceae bacterium]|jgi:UDP-N-acetylglucosamine 1-carboxyvinyltransferase|nr:UDP-N-acetylglucosamine 1-carboxyvinyltransferase [Gracilibacteraceae bacterium]